MLQTKIISVNADVREKQFVELETKTNNFLVELHKRGLNVKGVQMLLYDNKLCNQIAFTNIQKESTDEVIDKAFKKGLGIFGGVNKS